MSDQEADIIKQELDAALSRLRNDIDRVELWAGALSGFAQPVPDYEPAMQRYSLPMAFARDENHSN